jgi:rsbT antagonist protein RsbS
MPNQADRNGNDARLPLQVFQGYLVVSVQIELSLHVLERFKGDLLQRIREVGAKAVIVDMQEVAVLDPFEYEMLIQVGHMASVMGAELILAGMRPGVVASLVDGHINTEALRTTLSVDDALALIGVVG